MTIEEKIEAIHEGVQDIKLELARSIVHQEQHKEFIDKHDNRISILEAHKNKSLGIVATIGLIFGSIVTWLMHITSK